jgi:hypothetical protein
MSQCLKYPDYCSVNVLTMEFIKGIRIKDLIYMPVPQSKKIVQEDDSIAFIDYIEFGTGQVDERAELRATIREVAEKMESMGDKFISVKLKLIIIKYR